GPGRSSGGITAPLESCAGLGAGGIEAFFCLAEQPAESSPSPMGLSSSCSQVPPGDPLAEEAGRVTRSRAASAPHQTRREKAPEPAVLHLRAAASFASKRQRVFGRTLAPWNISPSAS